MDPPALWPRAEGRLRTPWNQVAFALNLCRQIKQLNPQQNLFISPAGLAVSLLLLRNGARGETQGEIERLLGLKDCAREELGLAVRDLIKEVNSVSDLELVLANSIWVHEQAELLSDFEGDAHTYFESDVERANFHSESTFQRMNAWIARKTRGKIPAISERVGLRAWVSLLNAVYFKGSWLAPFDPKETRPEVFTRSDGARKKVPMMSRHDYFIFVRGAGFDGAYLPYRGNRFCMLVILPKQSLEEFIEHLNPANWGSRLDHFGFGSVKMPRFRLKCEAELAGNLAKLGLLSAFDPRHADYSGIVRQPGNVHVGEIRHSSVCEVDELGTVAAAFTDLRLLGGPTELTLNRPFFFSIQEFRTNFILFLGAVEDPEQSA